VPPGGFPEIRPDVGAFLAGLLEGEASFHIGKQSRSTNHRCTMTVAMRSDEESLLQWLADETKLGRIAGRKAAGNSHPQVSWQVTAKADCERLCELMNSYPLRGRQSINYAIWSAAVASWIGEGPAHTERNRDWTAIAYFKRRLHHVKDYAGCPGRLSIADETAGLAGDWLGFFAGFVTAEGHLGLHRNGQSLAPRFQIALRADDRALLTELRTRSGDLGRLYASYPTRRSNPSVQWCVRDRDGLVALIRILDKAPPLGRRGREYEVWRLATLAHASSMPPDEKRELLVELSSELNHRRSGTRPPV
jgi:hypothetical protein